MICASPIFAVVATITFANAWHVVSQGVRVAGVVTELRNSGDVLCPVVDFKDQNGVQHTHYSSAGSSPPRFSVGEKIQIIYDPTDPKKARIDNFMHLWMFPLAFASGSFWGMIIGIACLRFGPRIIGWLNPDDAVSTAVSAQLEHGR